MQARMVTSRAHESSGGGKAKVKGFNEHGYVFDWSRLKDKASTIPEGKSGGNETACHQQIEHACVLLDSPKGVYVMVHIHPMIRRIADLT